MFRSFVQKFTYRPSKGLVFVSAAVIAAAVVTGLVISNKKVQTAEVTYSTSIDRGLNYLKTNRDDVSPFQWILLDYLQRSFELDPVFSAQNTKPKIPTDEIQAEKFRVYQRIAFPNELVDSLPTDDFPLPTARLLMAATHCDHIPLPADYQHLIQQNLEDGGYGVTYVAMSLQFLKENGCSLPPGYDQRVRELVAPAMVVIIEDPDTIPDLRYEAIAFLMQLNRRDLVQPEWLERIVLEQQKDGGWKNVSHTDRSNDHATVLALWALLNYFHKDVAQEPVLNRPAP